MPPGVNFTNILAKLLCKQIPKAQNKHVGKIDLWAQFHQHTKYCFYALKNVKKTVKLSVILRFQNLHAQNLRINMIVKSTPGLNFINVLCTAFTLADPESVKRYL